MAILTGFGSLFCVTREYGRVVRKCHRNTAVGQHKYKKATCVYVNPVCTLALQVLVAPGHVDMEGQEDQQHLLGRATATIQHLNIPDTHGEGEGSGGGGERRRT